MDHQELFVVTDALGKVVEGKFNSKMEAKIRRDELVRSVLKKEEVEEYMRKHGGHLPYSVSKGKDHWLY